MALEDPVKGEPSYAELTCGTENLSPYSNASGYSDQSSYYQTDYDWHHQQQQQQQHQYHHPDQQQQHHQSHQQPPHSVQNIQLTEIPPRQYYTTTSFQETQDLTTVGPYPGFSQHSLHQSDFYNPVLWPSSQADYIPATSLSTPSRLFSGIDVSQHVSGSGQQNVTHGQPAANTKPKRKRVQSHTQRKAANVRERRRMFHLNEAFDVLRKRLPAFNYEKRLSRIETLRLAMTYISFMKDVSIGEDPKCVKLKPHGLDLCSPNGLSSLICQEASPGCGTENHELNHFPNEYSDSSNDDLALQGGIH